MAKNIVLIGFMGTGKTSLGKLLARKLDYQFLDTDQLIEAESGLKIREIFQRYGEAHFRQLEADLARKLGNTTAKVISTGGGFPLKPENIQQLRSNGFIVLLQATPKVIYHRVSGDESRPLLKNPDPLGTIGRLLAERQRFYEKADFVLNTDEGDLDQLCETLLAEWMKRGYGNGTTALKFGRSQS